MKLYFLLNFPSAFHLWRSWFRFCCSAKLYGISRVWVIVRSRGRKVVEFCKIHSKSVSFVLTRKYPILLQSYIISSSEQLHHLQWNCLWFTSAREEKIKPQRVWETEAGARSCDVTKVIFCLLVYCWLVFCICSLGPRPVCVFSNGNCVLVAERVSFVGGGKWILVFRTSFSTKKEEVWSGESKVLVDGLVCFGLVFLRTKNVLGKCLVCLKMRFLSIQRDSIGN